MSNVIEQFIESMAEKGKSANTIKSYSADLTKYGRYLMGLPRGAGGLFSGHIVRKNSTRNFEMSSQSEDNESDTVINSVITNATTANIRAYIQAATSEGLSVATTNRRIQSIKALYAFLESKGITASNPAENVRTTKISAQNTTKWLQTHQVKELFKAIDSIKGERKRVLNRAVFSILVNTGLRAQEVCNIKLSDIDWDYGLISVVGKGKKFRKVPFNPATQRNVKLWMELRRDEGEYLFQSERTEHLSVRAIEHMASVLLPTLTFSFNVHQLRHTALKRIADTTGKIEIVASIAGHENVNTSRRYIEPSLEEIGAAMRTTEFDF